MFMWLFNCLLNFKHFLFASFGMDIFHLCVEYNVQCKQYHLTFAFWVFTQLPYYIVRASIVSILRNDLFNHMLYIL